MKYPRPFVSRLPSAAGFGRALRDEAEVSAVIAETNRALAELTARLDGLGKSIGAELNAAAKNSARIRRPRRVDGRYHHRYGDPAGRTRSEVVAILNRFGHTLPA